MHPSWPWPTLPSRIGPAPARESYLRHATRIIEVGSPMPGLRRVHPGYGFLSRECRVCRGLRGGRPRIRRAAGKRDPGDGQQVGCEDADGAMPASRWCRATTAWRRTSLLTLLAAAEAGRIGYPGPDQGLAPGAAARACAIVAAMRAGVRGGAGRLAKARSRRARSATTRCSIERYLTVGLGISRSRCSRTRRARQLRQPVRARLLDPASPSEDRSRKRRRPA